MNFSSFLCRWWKLYCHVCPTNERDLGSVCGCEIKSYINQFWNVFHCCSWKHFLQHCLRHYWHLSPSLPKSWYFGIVQETLSSNKVNNLSMLCWCQVAHKCCLNGSAKELLDVTSVILQWVFPFLTCKEYLLPQVEGSHWEFLRCFFPFLTDDAKLWYNSVVFDYKESSSGGQVTDP